jgi:hypothetical protein
MGGSVAVDDVTAVARTSTHMYAAQRGIGGKVCIQG